MQTAQRRIILVSLLAYAAAAWAFPWDKDMVDQPFAKPQRQPPAPAPDAVPLDGGETLPAPTTEQGMFDAKEDAASVANPVAATAESLERGAYLYEINCLVCHGAEGRGDGPVGELFETAPVDLNDDYTQDQADGQLYFTLTRGRGVMPFYRDALSRQERWHVVNYVKEAFGTQ